MIAEQPAEKTKAPGRPPKTPLVKAAEQAEALMAAINALPALDHHHMRINLNMRHDIVLVDLLTHLKVFAEVCKK